MKNKLLEIIREVNPKLVIHNDEDFDRPLREIGIDSLDTMSILLALDESHGVSIPEEEINERTTLSLLMTYIKQ